MIGKAILHYKILSKLGEGGMGVVYEAEDTKLERTVAIKFLPPHIAANHEERKRFEVEAKAAASLNHNNIATIYAIEEADDQTFIVMEYIKGQELKDKIDAGPVPIENTLDIAIQIAKGLQAAHTNDVIHRDIKSPNIMLTDGGNVKIMDFGLAKRGGQTKLTKEGTTLGTIAYMSPEQTRGEDVDRRSDIFSLGVLLYEMLTGQLPFKGEYDQAVTYSILNEEPDPVTGLRTGIPMELERIVNKCLKKDESDRYQGVKDLIVDLRGLKKGSDASRMSSTKGEASAQLGGKRVALGRPIIIGLVIVVAIVGYWLFSREPKIIERVPIAVVDFINETDEKELSGLSGMLITALEQSRHLDVISRARMFDELKKIGREDVIFIDETTGREIAKLANVRALAIATIRKLGETYTIDFRVIDPESGDRLYSTKEEGRGQDSVIGMIDRLSEKTRIDLKEKAEIVRMSSQSIADVTTPNLEAYHHYFLGNQLINKLKRKEASQQYREAVALDSSFALAYYGLAYAIAWDDPEGGREPLQKANELIDRLPEKEKYLVRALDTQIKKGYSAAVVILLEMEAFFPNDKDMLYEIGDGALHSYQFTTAEKYLSMVLELDPKYAKALDHLARLFLRTERYEEMKPMIDRLAQLNPEEAYQHWGDYYRFLAQPDEAVSNYEKLGERNRLSQIASALLWAGRYDEVLAYDEGILMKAANPGGIRNAALAHLGKKDLNKSLEILQSGLRQFPKHSFLMALVGQIYGLQGEYDKAEAYLTEMTQSNQPDRVQRAGFLELAWFYMYLGQYSESEKIFDQKLIPFAINDKDRNAIFNAMALKARLIFRGRKNLSELLGWIQAVESMANPESGNHIAQLTELHIAAGNIEKAKSLIASNRIQYLDWRTRNEAELAFAVGQWRDAVQKYDDRIRIDHLRNAFDNYRTAQAFYQMEEYDQAILRVKEAQNSYSKRGHPYVYPLGFHLLGRVYQQQGDTQLAIQNYEEFLDLWKDADEDLPDLIDAKTRLAKLKGASGG